MANKYSKYQLQPYVSQYVDPQRAQIASILRQRYEKNLTAHSGLTNAANSIKVGAGDQHLKDDAVAQIAKDFQDIATSNNYEDAGIVVQKAQQNFIANEGLVTAAQSYANWENEQKLAAEIRMKTGKNILFDKEYARDGNNQIIYNDDGSPQIVSKFDKHQSYYQDKNTGDMVKNVYQSTGQAQLQYADKQQSIIENIAGDPVALQRLSDAAGFDNPSDLYGYLVYGAEISDEKAVRLAKALSDVYINGTDEGKQQMLKLTTAVGSENLNPVTGDQWSPEEAEAIIQDQMIAIARQQVGMQLQYMTDQVYINALKNQELPVNKKLQTFNSDATTNSQVITGFDFIDDSDFDENGKLITLTKGGGGERRTKPTGREYLDKEIAILNSLGSPLTYETNKKVKYMDPDDKEAVLQAERALGNLKREYFTMMINEGKLKKGKDYGKGAFAKKNTVGMQLEGDSWQKIYGFTDEAYNDFLDWAADKRGLNFDSSEAYDRARARLDREMQAAKDEGRTPRLSILGADLNVYMDYMSELYPEVRKASANDKEFFQNMSKLQEKYEVSSTKIYRPTNKYVEGFREMILSTPTDYIVRREDGSFTNSIEDLQIELGYKKKNGEWKGDGQDAWNKMMEKAQIQGLMTGGQKPGSFAISMASVDGKRRVVELANSNEAQQQFRAPHEIINDLQSGRANDYRTPETAKVIQAGQAMLNDGTIVDVEMKVHYEINTETMEWEPVVTQYYYQQGTKTQAIEPEELRRQGSGVIDYLMEQAVSSYMSLHHMVGTDMNVGQNKDLTNTA